MGPSEKSFNQVKAILSKLDRTIDQLRAARAIPAPAGGSVPALLPVPSPQVQGSGKAGVAQFGRATPLPPRG